MRAAREVLSISTTLSSLTVLSVIAARYLLPTAGSTPPTTELPPPNGTSAAFADAAQSMTAATSFSLRGNATASGACGILRSNTRTASGKDFPSACTSRVEGSLTQMAARLFGGRALAFAGALALVAPAPELQTPSGHVTPRLTRASLSRSYAMAGRETGILTP